MRRASTFTTTATSRITPSETPTVSHHSVLNLSTACANDGNMAPIIQGSGVRVKGGRRVRHASGISSTILPSTSPKSMTSIRGGAVPRVVSAVQI